MIRRRRHHPSHLGPQQNEGDEQAPISRTRAPHPGDHLKISRHNENPSQTKTCWKLLYTPPTERETGIINFGIAVIMLKRFRWRSWMSAPGVVGSNGEIILTNGEIVIPETRMRRS